MASRLTEGCVWPDAYTFCGPAFADELIDCNNDGIITKGDLDLAVKAVFSSPMVSCPAADINNDGVTKANELTAIILSSSSRLPSPTATPSAMVSSTFNPTSTLTATQTHTLGVPSTPTSTPTRTASPLPTETTATVTPGNGVQVWGPIMDVVPSCEVVDTGNGQYYEKRQVEFDISLPAAGDRVRLSTAGPSFPCFNDGIVCNVGEPCAHCTSYSGVRTNPSCPEGNSIRMANDPQNSRCMVSTYYNASTTPRSVEFEVVTSSTSSATPTGAFGQLSCPGTGFNIQIQSADCGYGQASNGVFYQKLTAQVKVKGPLRSRLNIRPQRDPTGLGCISGFDPSDECTPGEDCIQCDHWTGVTDYPFGCPAGTCSRDGCPKGTPFRSPGISPEPGDDDPVEATCTVTKYSANSSYREMPAGPNNFVVELLPIQGVSSMGSVNCPQRP